MATAKGNVIVSFDNVCFSFNDKKKIILECADFTVRENTKITIMGQNGAGKSTIFKLLMREEKPESGKVNIVAGNKIAIARQVLPRDKLHLTIEEYFATAFESKEKKIEQKIEEVMDAVNLTVDTKKQLKDLSGGQQARILLAYALIQKPDILLLDEPTNNLDAEGIGHLLSFLLSYEKTAIVISHDADFLNVFTDGVLYLNVQKHQVEQYWGDYYTVIEDIKKQIEREQMQNARMEKEIQDKKDKINFFANKGGKMRKLASKMRDDVEEAEENTVTVRKDDKTIQKFHIDYGNFIGPIITISKITLMNREHEIVAHDLELIITK
jgi:ATPase subunit of ABC transporter with duplicated ATPase domains